MNYKTPDGHEYPEYTKFARWHGFITWIPLLVGENRVRFFALSNLREVVDPRLTNMVYTVPLSPIEQQLIDDMAQARIEWDWKHVFVTPEKYASIQATVGVRLCIQRPAPVIKIVQPTLWHERIAS